MIHHNEEIAHDSVITLSISQTNEYLLLVLLSSASFFSDRVNNFGKKTSQLLQVQCKLNYAHETLILT